MLIQFCLICVFARQWTIWPVFAYRSKVASKGTGCDFISPPCYFLSDRCVGPNDNNSWFKKMKIKIMNGLLSDVRSVLWAKCLRKWGIKTELKASGSTSSSVIEQRGWDIPLTQQPDRNKRLGRPCHVFSTAESVEQPVKCEVDKATTWRVPGR